MRNIFLGLLFGLLSICLAQEVLGPKASANPSPVVALQPLGPLEAALLTVVKDGIVTAFAASVIVLPERPLPSAAYYPPRQRWRAEKLLDFLDALPRKEALRVVGLTAQDISTTKDTYPDWGVFGLATMGGPSCVVSSFRLRRGVPEMAFHQRLVKVVNHELGHTFGLPHCPTPGCLMQDAEGTVKTVDRETGHFCASCRARLGALLR